MDKKEIVDSVIGLIKKEKCNIAEKIIRKIILKWCSTLFCEAYYSVSGKVKNQGTEGKAVFTLSFDCDLERDYEALPLLLKYLKIYDIKACFACIGKWVERLPEIHREILRQGHEIINHSYTHPSNIHYCPDLRFNQLSDSEREAEIVKADVVIENILGYKPIGFRTPHFGNSHTYDIYSVLSKIGYKYSSSTIAIHSPNYGNPFQINNDIWEFPLSLDPGNIVFCFDTWNRFKRSNAKHTDKTEKMFFDQLKWIIDVGITTNSYINVYFDPYDIVLLKGFIEFLSYLDNQKQKICVARYEDIVRILEGNS